MKFALGPIEASPHQRAFSVCLQSIEVNAELRQEELARPGQPETVSIQKSPVLKSLAHADSDFPCEVIITGSRDPHWRNGSIRSWLRWPHKVGQRAEGFDGGCHFRAGNTIVTMATKACDF
jgi:hypothetical protein